MTVIRVVGGILLLAHGLVHLLFVVPDAADPSYPFSLDRSWVLPEAARRPFAYVLMAAVVVAFLVSALAFWGLPPLSGAWPAITIVAGSLSLILLVAFWDRRLWIGALISSLLILLAILRPPWITEILG